MMDYHHFVSSPTGLMSHYVDLIASSKGLELHCKVIFVFMKMQEFNNQKVQPQQMRRHFGHSLNCSDRDHQAHPACTQGRLKYRYKLAVNTMLPEVSCEVANDK